MINLYEVDDSDQRTVDARDTHGHDLVVDGPPCHGRKMRGRRSTGDEFIHTSVDADAPHEQRPLRPISHRNTRNVVWEVRRILHTPTRPNQTGGAAMALNVHEAIAVQRVAHLLRGGHDLTDEGVRDAIARDLTMLEEKSKTRLGAGPVDSPDRWSRRLADLADESGAA